MDDLTSKINDLLSDEESLQQIKELADMLTGSSAFAGNTAAESPSPDDGTESFDPPAAGYDDGSSKAATSGGDTSNGFDFSALAGILGGLGQMNGSPQTGGTASDGFGGFDIVAAMRIISIIKSSGENDINRGLLAALRPLLSADKQAKVDKALRLLRIYSVFIAMRESGLDKELGKLIIDN